LRNYRQPKYFWQSWYFKVSICLNIVWIKSLNLDSFKTQVSTFEKFSTVSKPLPSLNSCNILKSKFLKLSQTQFLKKFLAVATPSIDSQKILDAFMNEVRTVSLEVSICLDLILIKTLDLDTSKSWSRPLRNSRQL